MSADQAREILAQSGPPQYVRAVTPRLRRVLYVVFGLFALLGANAIYLSAVTFAGWIASRRAGLPVSYENLFYQYMFLLHLLLGLLLIVPFVAFGVLHLLAARKRRNRRAVGIGYALFAISLLLLVTGILLMRVGGLEIRHMVARRVFYWAHIVSPVVAVWLYWLHRLAGPRIKWRVGGVYLAAVGAVVAVMLVLQTQDPRKWNQVGPAEGAKYFEPSLARTSNGSFIPERVLMNDQYCLKCHQDVYQGWLHSAHHFSSFNNPAYLVSVRETRDVVKRRDGSVKASRWCAGCHDPVPFFSGAFDNPDFDDIKSSASQAGITCTVCHAITHANSVVGNADYTIEEPLHYPFAFSDNKALRFINETLVKAKPEFHKQTFLKPLHKSAQFCSTCHKVHLPKALNAYKDFLRGQNHFDSYWLSGVSGISARSFYYPKQAEQNCNDCHMPAKPSRDFAARPLPGSDGVAAIHDHLFPGGNTGITWMRGDDEATEAQASFLRNDIVRVDIFGVREGADVTGELHAPLRPVSPVLKPGESYLLETVIRTLKLGHHFTQGTTDSNEIWLEVVVKSGDQVLAHSGSRDAMGEVDPYSHFVNNFVIDRHGNRISRRNAQDIFVVLYNHQIPPGAGQTVHYQLDVPADQQGPLEVSVKLNYRKFDKQYTDFMARSLTAADHEVRGVTPGKPAPNPLPIVVLAEDRVVFSVGVPDEAATQQPDPPWPAWQRWNDYGIGMLLKGKAELRQAGEAFRQVQRYDGPLNLARALLAEGLLDEAGEAVAEATAHTEPAPPPWTVAWLSGSINLEQGRFVEAQRNFEKVLTDSTPEMRRRGFDFSRDYVVINLLGRTLYEQAKQQVGDDRSHERGQFLEAARDQFLQTLVYDPENLEAHHNLHLIFASLDRPEEAEKHRQLHLRYKPDESAVEARALARRKYPAANQAAEPLVVYRLASPSSATTPSTPNSASSAEQPVDRVTTTESKENNND
ncbi:MAG: tetratricopeptide repeat protein [Planctomycetales bacterium]|nr:tetratricopeptide repeat protein [Planctomycetales bacterium]